MFTLTLSAHGTDCIDCAKHAADGDWSHAVACLVTLAITAIIRRIEIKRIKKKQQNK